MSGLWPGAVLGQCQLRLCVALHLPASSADRHMDRPTAGSYPDPSQPFQPRTLLGMFPRSSSAFPASQWHLELGQGVGTSKEQVGHTVEGTRRLHPSSAV